MGVEDRDYIRGQHPPACTCVECTRRRLGKSSKGSRWRNPSKWKHNKKQKSKTPKLKSKDKANLEKLFSMDKCPNCGQSSLYWNEKIKLYECLNNKCQHKYTEKQYTKSVLGVSDFHKSKSNENSGKRTTYQVPLSLRIRRKFRKYTRPVLQKVRRFARSRWFIIILGLLIVFLSIAFWPNLLDSWPRGAESFIKWLEIPVEVFGGLLVLIGLFAGRYRTRIKAIRFALILLAIVTVATYAYYYLDDSGKIDEWLDRSSDEDTLSGMIKEKIPTMTDTIGELRTIAEDKLGDVGDIVSDAFEDDRVWVDGAYLVGAKGNAIKLDNNSKAQNPSWSQLIEFLKRDDTDKQRYSYNSFVCADFAEMLHNNAEDAGWRCAYVCVDLSIGGHALNAFETTDKGLVYIDCTNSISLSPRSADKTVEVKVGKAYIPISIFPETGWNSIWDSMGTVTQIETVKW